MSLDCKKEMDKIVDFIKSHFKLNGFKKAILGISGGLDSAIVAALAKKALGKDNVYGYVILETPIELNEDARFELSQMMSQTNSEVATGGYLVDNVDQLTVWQKAFPNAIFPQEIIVIMNRGAWDFSDLIKIQEGLAQAGDNFCDGFSMLMKSPYFSEEFGNNYDMQLTLQLCEAKPDQIFVRKGAHYEVNFPDVELAEYKRYDSRNVREEKYDDCGEDGCEDGQCKTASGPEPDCTTDDDCGEGEVCGDGGECGDGGLLPEQIGAIVIVGVIVLGGGFLFFSLKKKK